MFVVLQVLGSPCNGVLLGPVLLLVAAAGSLAEPQVLVLSADKMPSIQPLTTAGVDGKGLQSLQKLQHLQNLQNLQGAVERAKRSGNILQLLGSSSGSSSSGGSGGGGGGLLGGKGILGSILGSSSSNSVAAGPLQVAGKGPTYGNYIGTGAGLPMVSFQLSKHEFKCVPKLKIVFEENW